MTAMVATRSTPAGSSAVSWGAREAAESGNRGRTAPQAVKPDAHLAALLLQHGVRTLYTNDRDFRKFDFLETRNPLR